MYLLSQLKFHFLTIVLLSVCCSASEEEPCVLVEPNAESLCIPLRAINKAFTEARLAIHLIEPYPFQHYKAHHHHHEIDRLGIAITETSRILAKQFQLNHHQIFYFLPKLDVTLTDIWKFCPAQFKHKVCELTRYRSLSGHCNNLIKPDWGATFTPFSNILPPQRPDGVSDPKDYNEGQLPSARVVSTQMHRDAVVHDHAITTMLIAWGQIIDHDVTLTAETKDGRTKKDPNCCSASHLGQVYGQPYDEITTNSDHPHHNCYPILIPHDDPFYSHYGQNCMNFARSFAGVRSDCRLGPRTAFNTISSYLDASFAYGSNYELTSELRSGKYGLLKSLPVFQEYGLKDLLPPKVEEPDDGCIRSNTDVFCFLAGDIRVNEQLVLTVLHTLFMREHNRIAKSLAHINPHWDDEKLFQETRHIIIAMVQHITFDEFLPMILGKDVMHHYGLTPQQDGYWNGYDPKVNPSALEEFITSAFRFGHSLLPNRIERWTHGHRYIDSKDLSKLIRQPYDVYRPGYVDTFVMGMVNQLAQAMDEGVTEQVTTLLFKEPQEHFGMDLAAMNIQRGREHGVPSYTAYREVCGLSPIGHWDDLVGVMKNDTVYRYKQIYRSPHHIDLWSGGVSEVRASGSLLGPTFGCIIAMQFQALKYGDRFWYELPDLPSSFIPEQLHEIRKAKLSRMLCDNSDALKTVQIYAMVYPDPDINPRVPCEGHIIPRINLEAWREAPLYSSPLEHEHQPHDHDHQHPHAHSQQHSNLNKVSNNISYYQKDIYHQDYQTLHPPEFDESYINLKHPPENDYTYSDDTADFSRYSTSEKIKQNPAEYREHVESYKGNNIKTAVHKHPTEKSKEHKHIETIEPEYPSHVVVGNSHTSKDSKIEHRHKGQRLLLESLQAPPAPSFKIVSDRKVRRPAIRRGLPKIKPFPESPFPGMSGLFSPNPGYLVRQKFSIYKAPVSHPHTSFWQPIMG